MERGLPGWRGGEVKNNSNDPAAVSLRSVGGRLGSHPLFGCNRLKNKEFIVPGQSTGKRLKIRGSSKR
jgi:hypothetical protein